MRELTGSPQCPGRCRSATALVDPYSSLVTDSLTTTICAAEFHDRVALRMAEFGEFQHEFASSSAVNGLACRCGAGG